MKNIIRIVIIFCINIAIAQNRNNNWYFGVNAAISFNNNSISSLSNSSINTTEGTSSISDENGNLLFYTDGVTVWNKNNQVMPNGTGLLGHESATQSALIVPKPGDCNIYYLFTTPAEDTITPLSYNIIDMTKNGGLGDIIQKNTPILKPVTERLYATIHSNGLDYWIVSQKYFSNDIVSFKLSSNGFDATPIFSNLTGIETENSVGIFSVMGYMKLSRDGKKIAFTDQYGYNRTVLMNFDNSTGKASNPKLLYHNSWGYGLEFSPDNSKLYVATSNAPFVLWQYDISSNIQTIIQNSQTTIDSQMNNKTQTSLEYGGALQLGPDDKIYVGRTPKKYLGVINSPNLSKSACGFVDSVISLGSGMFNGGLPNLIKNYIVCPSLKIPCDTSLLSLKIKDTAIFKSDSVVVLLPNKFTIKISPNFGFRYSKDSSYIVFKPVQNTNFSIEISDTCLNKKVYSYNIGIIEDTSHISCNYWVPNSFSPNNDNINDIFTLYTIGSCYKNIDFKIFNRWGEQLFYYSGNGNTPIFWDGKYKNETQSNGVYIYTLELKDINNKVNFESGSVNLIR